MKDYITADNIYGNRIVLFYIIDTTNPIFVTESNTLQGIIDYIEKYKLYEYPMKQYDTAEKPDFSKVNDIEDLQREINKFSNESEYYKVFYLD